MRGIRFLAVALIFLLDKTRYTYVPGIAVIVVVGVGERKVGR